MLTEIVLLKATESVLTETKDAKAALDRRELQMCREASQSTESVIADCLPAMQQFDLKTEVGRNEALFPGTGG